MSSLQNLYDKIRDWIKLQTINQIYIHIYGSYLKIYDCTVVPGIIINKDAWGRG